MERASFAPGAARELPPHISFTRSHASRHHNDVMDEAHRGSLEDPYISSSQWA